MTWLEASHRYINAAERAFAAGDMAAFSDLVTAAAQCVRIARNFDEAKKVLDELARLGPR